MSNRRLADVELLYHDLQQRVLLLEKWILLDTLEVTPYDQSRAHAWLRRLLFDLETGRLGVFTRGDPYERACLRVHQALKNVTEEIQELQNEVAQAQELVDDPPLMDEHGNKHCVVCDRGLPCEGKSDLLEQLREGLGRRGTQSCVQIGEELQALLSGKRLL